MLTNRSTPRLIEFNRWGYVEAEYPLDITPETAEHRLSLQRSNSGKVQTQPETPSDRLRIVIPGVSDAFADRIRLLWARTLTKGGRVDFVRDAGRGMHIPGDSAVDAADGFWPLSGSLYDIDTYGGRYSTGAVFCSPADPPRCSRTNLFPNGDNLDTLAWTNATPTTLQLWASQYMSVGGPGSKWLKIARIGSGTAYCEAEFDTDGMGVNALAARGLQVSFLIRADIPPYSGISNLVTAKLVMSGALLHTVWQGTPGVEPQRVSAFVSTVLSEASTDSTGHKLQLTLSADAAQIPVYITEIQIEARRGRTAFVPYSTSRTARTGSRDTQGLRYLHTVAFRNQIPTWKAGGRFEGTLAFDFTPGWEPEYPPVVLVEAGVNDRIDFRRPTGGGGTVYTATLTPGQYEWHSLAAEARRTMRTAAGGNNNHITTYDSTTGKFTFTGTAAFDLIWDSGPNHSRTAARLFGFDPDADYLDDTSHTSPDDVRTYDENVLVLATDGDLENAGTTPGLEVTLDATGVVTATLALQGGATASVSNALSSITEEEAQNVIVTFKESDGSNPNTGTLKISTDNGASFSSTTFTARLARLGERLFFGVNRDGTIAAGVAFNSIQFDPVYISASQDDGTYYSATTERSRTRNAWRCVLDPQHRGNPIVEKDNINTLDLSLFEVK